MAEQIKPLCIKAGQGLDFNGDFAANAVYQIGNLESQTSNAPLNSNSSCLLFRTLNTGIVVDMLIGIEQPFIYGRYNKGSWNKLL